MEKPRLTTQIQQTGEYMSEAVEGKVLNELLLLDEAYRSFFVEYLKELGLQRMAADKLWPLTRDLSGQTDFMCQEPQARTIDGEELVTHKYQLHYQIILGSNTAMHRGLMIMRGNLLAFRREYNKLDLTEETAFILGNDFHKPIQFFNDLATELFNYFYSHYLKLDAGSYHLDPSDLASLESYQKMLAPSEEFEEYFAHNLSYCHCLRPKRACPELPRTKTAKPSEMSDAKKRALLKRCQRRRAKMTRGTIVEHDESTPAFAPGESSLINTVQRDHELRMNQLSWRLANLRENATRGHDYERQLVQQMIYALSPSLIPAPHQRQNLFE